MKALYVISTGAIIGMADGPIAEPGPDMGVADAPSDLTIETVALFKWDGAAVVKKTGAEYQDAWDKVVKPAKKNKLEGKYGQSVAGLMLTVIDLLDKVVNGQSLNNNEKKQWKDEFADKVKKAKADMEADPEWPGA